MLKIRRPLGRLIFNMGIAIPGKTVFLIETAPRPQRNSQHSGWLKSQAIFMTRSFFFNTLRLRQNGPHFSKCIFLNENVWIVIKISMKFVLQSPINNIPALVQMMAWHRPGNKPLSESMMISSMTQTSYTKTLPVKTNNIKSLPVPEGHHN